MGTTRKVIHVLHAPNAKQVCTDKAVRTSQLACVRHARPHQGMQTTPAALGWSLARLTLVLGCAKRGSTELHRDHYRILQRGVLQSSTCKYKESAITASHVPHARWASS